MDTTTISANAILIEKSAQDFPSASGPGPAGEKSPAGPAQLPRVLPESTANEALDTLLSAEDSENLAALNAMLSPSNNQLSISVDQATGNVTFRITDATTGDVVLEVPSAARAGISKALLLRRGLILDTNQ